MPARLLLLLLAFAMGGCAASPWERNYVPHSAAPRLPGSAAVSVRSVPWERVVGTLRELEAEVAASDSHPDEWPEERRAAARARLLRGLQVSESPERVAVVGRSEFRSTERIRPETAEGTARLASFARRVGADTVVWTARYVGKADAIVDQPVTTHAHGLLHRRGDGRDIPYSETTTTWVPVVVRADEYAFIAYFLRRDE